MPRLVKRCDQWMEPFHLPLGDLFIRTSPEFIDAACSQSAEIKERIFRLADNNPMDGQLDAAELRDGLMNNMVGRRPRYLYGR